MKKNSRRTRNNIGVIGLGIIGQRVADKLRHAGFHVFVWNRTPRAVPNFVGSRAEVAELCDYIQIFVADDEALLQTVQQLTPALNAQHVVLAHCTVAPETMCTAAEIVQRRGARFLDAPFTGSKLAAQKGELIYYVGGDEVALREVSVVLEASSKEILYVGDIGDATMIKIATNMITAASVQAASEALALIEKSGISPERFATALRSNASNSGTLALKVPKMIEGNFEPHFSVKHMLKDLQAAYRLGRSHDLEFTATAAARDALIDEVRKGNSDADYCSAIRKFFPERGKTPPPEPELFEFKARSEPAIEPPRAPEPLPVEPEPEPEPEREKQSAPIAVGTKIDVAALFAAMPTSSSSSARSTAAVAEEEENAEEDSKDRSSFLRRLLRRREEY